MAEHPAAHDELEGHTLEQSSTVLDFGPESGLTGESTSMTDDGSSTESSQENQGRWGEQRTGGEIRPRAAMQEFETLRRELTSLSRTKSHPPSEKEREGGLLPMLSRKSTHRQRRQSTVRTGNTSETEPGDLEAGPGEKDDEFELDQFMREGHFEKRKGGQSAKKVGVVWRNLTVKGVGSTATFVRTLPDAILGSFGPDFYKIITRFVPALKLESHAQTRTLINDFTGVVKDGEMMLVLGQPGSGCSTFLKAIANDRGSYASVEGAVSYGGIPADKQQKRFRGEVNYNPEDDTHFANLNVWQTLYFALINKSKKGDKGDIPIVLEALLKIFGISHTKFTPVGDEYVRGVSGGERKRVYFPLSIYGVLGHD